MAHPVFWPSKTFFYPVGNTSPVCLTDYLPPEQNANILLLGCGDARNILYTIYTNGPSSELAFIFIALIQADDARSQSTA